MFLKNQVLIKLIFNYKYKVTKNKTHIYKFIDVCFIINIYFLNKNN